MTLTGLIRKPTSLGGGNTFSNWDTCANPEDPENECAWLSDDHEDLEVALTQIIAQAEVDFVLKEMEGHATNVHYFGGVQFQQFGMHHVEIHLGDELRLRFPLPVVEIKTPANG